MGIIATNKNQITFIYNSESSIGKQALAYVSASKKKLLSIDTSKTKVTSTQWVEIAQNLHVAIDELIQKEHPDFLKLYGKEVLLETDGWLKVIDKNPQVVVSPILIKGADFFQIKSPSEIIDYLEPDSANVSRNPAEETD